VDLQQGARRLSLELGDWLGVSTSLINLADASLARGDDRAARDYARESADLARTHRHDMRLVTSLLNLGLAHLKLGMGRDAAIAYDEALELCERHHLSDSAAYGLIGLAGLALERGECRRAGLLLGAAHELLAEVGAELESSERLLHDRTIQQVGRQLGAVELEKAVSEGATLSLSEAIHHGRRLAGSLKADLEPSTG
jgi:tetratricopeptide (TPR) repeat protein